MDSIRASNIFMYKVTVKSIHTALALCASILVGISFLTLIIAVIIQVTGRAGLFDSPVWTEELTRFALLYLAAFGTGLSYLKGELVNVDILCNTLPARLSKLLQLLTAAIVIVFCLLLIHPSWQFAQIGLLQSSPALGWNMAYIFASILCMLTGLILFTLVKVIHLLKERAE